MNTTAWVQTKFGTAEQFKGCDNETGVFYSHAYTPDGAADVMEAAADYIKTTSSGEVARMALVLLADKGEPDTDLYRKQTTERWRIYAQDFVDLAQKLILCRVDHEPLRSRVSAALAGCVYVYNSPQVGWDDSPKSKDQFTPAWKNKDLLDRVIDAVIG